MTHADCDCWFIRLEGQHYPDCNKGLGPEESQMRPRYTLDLEDGSIDVEEDGSLFVFIDDYNQQGLTVSSEQAGALAEAILRDREPPK